MLLCQPLAKSYDLETRMELICYLHPGWAPQIRPAEAARDWMDATPEAFAYRCLPLNIANAHGWELLSPCDVEAYWTGTSDESGVVVKNAPGTAEHDKAVSIFGQGTLTFHIQALFRTPPGWDLLIGGSPNRPKDAIAPLSGVIETDWSPYTFTMNWKFTRRNTTVRFKKGEPICFITPVQRGVLERFNPIYVSLENNVPLMQEYLAWSRSRTSFRADIANASTPAEKWQKRYYRGLGMDDRRGVTDHMSRLRLRAFDMPSADDPVHVPDPPAASLDADQLRALLAAARGRRGASSIEAAMRGMGVDATTAARAVAGLDDDGGLVPSGHGADLTI